MFTGITQGLYLVIEVEKQIDLVRYTVELTPALLSGLKIGASVSVDGVCQTVERLVGQHASFTAIAETLRKTTLAELSLYQKVSVERSLRIGDELGGHEVSGHVFETALIVARQATENNLSLQIQCSNRCIHFIYEKGFVAIDGSSLTVGPVDRKQARFTVYLIPETIKLTNLGTKLVGAKVNLEPDANILRLQTIMQPYLEQIDRRLEALEERINQRL